MTETEVFEAVPRLDTQWYSRFKETGSFQAFEFLSGDKVYRNEQKGKFLSQEVENPVLDYPVLDDKDLIKREQELLTLKKDVLASEQNEIVRQVYRWRINEKVAELRMLQAVSRGDMRRFRKYSEFIYGRPSSEIFTYTIQSLRLELEQYLNSENPELRKVAEELTALLPQDLEATKVFSLPTKEMIQLAQKRTLQEMGTLVNIPEISEILKSEDIKEAFEQALQSLKAKGWQVVIGINSATGISVSQEKKEVKVPESRTMLFNKLRMLIAHEIGTHVARRIKGERSKLMLLGLGLDRFEQGEEGIATMREQAVRGEVRDFSGLEGHLAISLAYGLDGKPRDFRKLYEFLEKYYLLKRLARGEDFATAEKDAQTNAWNKCVRTFRGTDCVTPGTCFTKDIIYRQGNIGIWEVVRERPEEMQRFSVGKYDPRKPKTHLFIGTVRHYRRKSDLVREVMTSSPPRQTSGLSGCLLWRLHLGPQKGGVFVARRIKGGFNHPWVIFPLDNSI